MVVYESTKRAIKKYQEKNYEEILKKNRDYYQQNAEKKKAYVKVYRLKQREIRDEFTRLCHICQVFC
jgi:hypothetical protein